MTEGWEFVGARGRYEKLSYPEGAYAAFVDAVLDIEARVTQVYQLNEPQQQA